MGNYRGADLNLLKVFEALMTEGNVTRAAHKLALTQPSVSNALARLRQTFDDALFVRSGAGVAPTRRALDLWAPLAQSLQAIRATLEGESFDALHSRASVRIAMSDYVASIVVPRLSALLATAAPGLRLHTIPNTLVDFGQVLAHDQADFTICAYADEVQRPDFVKSRALWAPDFVCVLRSGHALAGLKKIPLKRFLAAAHIDVSLVGKTLPTYDAFLRSRGLQRNLAVTVNHYATACDALRTSDLIAVLPWSKDLDPPARPHERPAAPAGATARAAARGRTVLAPAPRNRAAAPVDEGPAAWSVCRRPAGPGTRRRAPRWAGGCGTGLLTARWSSGGAALPRQHLNPPPCPCKPQTGPSRAGRLRSVCRAGQAPSGSSCRG